MVVAWGISFLFLQIPIIPSPCAEQPTQRRYSDHRPASLLSPVLPLHCNTAKKKEAPPAISADTGSWLLMQDQEGRVYW